MLTPDTPLRSRVVYSEHYLDSMCSDPSSAAKEVGTLMAMKTYPDEPGESFPDILWDWVLAEATDIDRETLKPFPKYTVDTAPEYLYKGVHPMNVRLAPRTEDEQRGYDRAAMERELAALRVSRDNANARIHELQEKLKTI